MLTIAANSSRDLSPDDIEHIADILKLPNLSTLLRDTASDDGMTFHDVFWGLIESGEHRALSIDWKWGAEDFVALISRAIGIDCKLEQATYNNDTQSYALRLVVQDTLIAYEIPLSQPDKLITMIENTCKLDGEFLACNFLDDSYNWIYVPAKVPQQDIMRLCDLTGYELEQDSESPSNNPVDIDAVTPQKIFFFPNITEKTAGGTKPIPTHWAGRVLAGQTIRQGIAAELNEMHKYTGNFECFDMTYSDTTKDRKGNDIKRYNIKIVLLPDES